MPSISMKISGLVNVASWVNVRGFCFSVPDFVYP